MNKLDLLVEFNYLRRFMYDCEAFDYIDFSLLEKLSKNETVDLMISVIEYLVDCDLCDVEIERKIIADHYYSSFEHSTDLFRAVSEYILISPIARNLQYRHSNFSVDELATIIYLYTDVETTADCITIASDEIDWFNIQADFYESVLPYLKEEYSEENYECEFSYLTNNTI